MKTMNVLTLNLIPGSPLVNGSVTMADTRSSSTTICPSRPLSTVDAMSLLLASAPDVRFNFR